MAGVGQTVSALCVYLVGDHYDFDLRVCVRFLVLFEHLHHLLLVRYSLRILLHILHENNVDDQGPPIATQHQILTIRLQLILADLECRPD